MEKIEPAAESVHGKCLLYTTFFWNSFWSNKWNTTVHILLNQLTGGKVKNSSGGQSDTSDSNKVLSSLKSQIDRMINGIDTFTFIMDDPASNSYLQVRFKNYYLKQIINIIDCLAFESFLKHLNAFCTEHPRS